MCFPQVPLWFPESNRWTYSTPLSFLCLTMSSDNPKPCVCTPALDAIKLDLSGQARTRSVTGAAGTACFLSPPVAPRCMFLTSRPEPSCSLSLRSVRYQSVTRRGPATSCLLRVAEWRQGDPLPVATAPGFPEALPFPPLWARPPTRDPQTS